MFLVLAMQDQMQLVFFEVLVLCAVILFISFINPLVPDLVSFLQMVLSVVGSGS